MRYRRPRTTYACGSRPVERSVGGGREAGRATDMGGRAREDRERPGGRHGFVDVDPSFRMKWQAATTVQ
jgi:hypothetical protein